jgi:hypothetical protein
MVRKDRPVESTWGTNSTCVISGNPGIRLWIPPLSSTPLVDPRRVERNVENKVLAAEGRRVSPGLGMVFENDRLEPLTGKGGGTTEAGQTGADDEGVDWLAGRGQNR